MSAENKKEEEEELERIVTGLKTLREKGDVANKEKEIKDLKKEISKKTGEIKKELKEIEELNEEIGEIRMENQKLNITNRNLNESLSTQKQIHKDLEIQLAAATKEKETTNKWYNKRSEEEVDGRGDEQGNTKGKKELEEGNRNKEKKEKSQEKEEEDGWMNVDIYVADEEEEEDEEEYDEERNWFESQKVEEYERERKEVEKETGKDEDEEERIYTNERKNIEILENGDIGVKVMVKMGNEKQHKWVERDISGNTIGNGEEEPKRYMMEVEDSIGNKEKRSRRESKGKQYCKEDKKSPFIHENNICEFFKKGRCKFEDKCWKIHQQQEVKRMKNQILQKEEINSDKEKIAFLERSIKEIKKFINMKNQKRGKKEEKEIRKKRER